MSTTHLLLWLIRYIRRMFKEFALNSQTQTILCFTARCFWQLLLTVYCYLTLYQRAWQPGQHRLVWKSRATWWLHVFLAVFSSRCFALRKTELNMTLLVMQTILTAMSHLCRVRTVNTKTHCNLALRIALVFQFGVQDTSQTPSLSSSTSFISHLLSFSRVYLPYFSLPWPRFALSLGGKAGWVITGGLRAGWLPLIESSQQVVFYETALSSQPARACPRRH